MKERLFRFKQFSVSHFQSAMKVGVDAVMLGAWANVHNKKSILDVGTGCGVIALAIAQRADSASIDAIDIDKPSIQEALQNFSNSPWRERLHGYETSFDDYIDSASQKYDLIISNPPFYDSGVISPADGREKARHIGELSPYSIIAKGVQLLTDDGVIALIAPAEMENKLLDSAAGSGLFLLRMLRIKGTLKASSPKRVMMEFSRKKISEPKISDTLVIQTDPGVYTREYMTLTQDFYLKF